MNPEKALVGHWPFRGDCRDHSQFGHEIQACRALQTGAAGPNGTANTAALFDGRASQITVAHHPALNFGTADFSIAVWVHTDKDVTDVLGDIVSKYDPASRNGFNFSIVSHSGVTGTHANDRNVHFGIDNGRIDPRWTDCGRVGRAVWIASLCVFDGQLYTATLEPNAGESGHVYRYVGPNQWKDCGSPAACNAVSSLAVCQGSLYCGTMRYKTSGSCLPESPNKNPGGKVFRYNGPNRWIDCGQLDDGDGIHCMAVFVGELYAAPLYDHGIFVYQGGTEWKSIGPDARVMCLGAWNGHLYALTSGRDNVYRLDQDGRWDRIDSPPATVQLYSFAVYRGKPHIGTWPGGDVFRYDDATWTSVGSPGYTLETMGMAVYNGKLYAGVLPMASVYRYDADNGWTYTGTVDNSHDVQLRRAWSMAVHDGKLFCGTLPSGHVLSLEAGKLASYDHPLEPGWKHLTAVRRSDRLEVFVDGELRAQSSDFDPQDFDLTNDQPLSIAFGAHDNFNGRMSDLCLYNRALRPTEVVSLAQRNTP